MAILYALVASLAATSLALASLHPRQQCPAGYELCVAEGATNGAAPSVGDPDLLDLYVDLVDSINAAKENQGALRVRVPVSGRVRRQDDGHDEKQEEGNDDDDEEDRVVPDLCCKANAGMQCLLLQGIRISFCWDRFTTNFHFADGSYGTITSGFYTTGAGDVVNLLNGTYTLADGETGNIYDDDDDDDDDAARPNPSTLDLPTPWTSAGVGTAIPGSELGVPATMTRATTPATTAAATATATATTMTTGASSLSGVTPATATATGDDATETDTSAAAALHRVAGRGASWMLLVLSALHAVM